MAVTAGGWDYRSVSGAVRRWQRDKPLAVLTPQGMNRLKNS